jgi:hypothetical protein
MAQLQKDEDRNIPPGFTLRHVLRGHTDDITQIAWSPDGRAVFDLLRRCGLWTPQHKQQGVWKPESNAGASTEERAL